MSTEYSDVRSSDPLSVWISKQSRELVERNRTKKPQSSEMLCQRGKVNWTYAYLDFLLQRVGMFRSTGDRKRPWKPEKVNCDFKNKHAKCSVFLDNLHKLYFSKEWKLVIVAAEENDKICSSVPAICSYCCCCWVVVD